MISYSERIKIENGLRTRGKSYIREFVENGGPVDEVVTRFLKYVIVDNRLDCLSYMVEVVGIDIESNLAHNSPNGVREPENSKVNNPLIAAVTSGCSAEILNVLLLNGCNLMKWGPVAAFVERKTIPKFISLAERFPWIVENITRLNELSEGANTELMKFLLQHCPNIDVNATKQTGYRGHDMTMLLSAISSKSPELQDMLLKHPDIDVHKSCPQTKMSPFKLAASTLYKPAVNKLLNHPQFDLSRELEMDKELESFICALSAGWKDVVEKIANCPSPITLVSSDSNINNQTIEDLEGDIAVPRNVTRRFPLVVNGELLWRYALYASSEMTEYLMTLLGDTSYEEIEIDGAKVNLFMDACRLGRSTIVKKLLKNHSLLFREALLSINNTENYLMFLRERILEGLWIAIAHGHENVIEVLLQILLDNKQLLLVPSNLLNDTNEKDSDGPRLLSTDLIFKSDESAEQDSSASASIPPVDETKRLLLTGTLWRGGIRNACINIIPHEKWSHLCRSLFKQLRYLRKTELFDAFSLTVLDEDNFDHYYNLLSYTDEQTGDTLFAVVIRYAYISRFRRRLFDKILCVEKDPSGASHLKYDSLVQLVSTVNFNGLSPVMLALMYNVPCAWHLLRLPWVIDYVINESHQQFKENQGLVPLSLSFLVPIMNFFNISLQPRSSNSIQEEEEESPVEFLNRHKFLTSCSITYLALSPLVNLNARDKHGRTIIMQLLKVVDPREMRDIHLPLMHTNFFLEALKERKRLTLEEFDHNIPDENGNTPITIIHNSDLPRLRRVLSEGLERVEQLIATVNSLESNLTPIQTCCNAPSEAMDVEPDTTIV